MNRNQFLKLTGLTGIALANFPYFAFGQNANALSYDELIGKGNPQLYGDGFKVRKEVYDAFSNMKDEALKDGISLKVVSSYRGFNHQKSIWERKYKRYTAQGMDAQSAIQKIIDYSTIPGTSRHHWGTDMDLVDANAKQPTNVLNPSNFDEAACFGPFKKWMDANANTYGFYLVYTNEAERKGFKYEPWHYSYKPLSLKYLSDYRQLNLFEILQKEKLIGSDQFTDVFLNVYLKENILDINPELL
ncbi:MAG: M15 family metallopeptidase [Aquaticitalea sp.]